jgi:3-oxoadipate enol-lactonase
VKTVDLHFTDSGGSGDAVVLAHAIGCDHRMWDDLRPRLAADYRVVALDTRGHGRSPVAPRPYSLADLADDAAAVLDRLGIAHTHWVGLSMGGMVGQAFALRHPGRIDRMVLANTTSSYGPEGRAMWQARAKLVAEGGLAAIRDMVATRYFSEEFRAREPDVVAQVMQRFLETPAEGYLGCCDAIANLDFAGDLPRMRARTLVIAGGADAGTPPAMSEAMAAKIPGARLAVIAGAAHLSAVEKPAQFAQLVREFLASRAD